jgi:hypothetical protein
MTLDHACHLGNSSNELIKAQAWAEASELLEKLLEDCEAAGYYDSFVLSKIALNLLIANIHREKVQSAHQIWKAEPSQTSLGIGVFGLEENPQVSLWDLMVYQQVQCLLAVKLDWEPEKASELLTGACEKQMALAQELGDKSVMLVILRNWKDFLMQIWGPLIPSAYTEPISRWEQQLDISVALGAPELFLPADWGLGWESKENVI